MKGLVLYGPNDFGIKNNIRKPQPKEDWAVVKTAFAGICGSDLPRFFKTGSYRSPMILGHEFSGVIEKAAKGGKLKEGTKVAVLPIIPCGQCDGCQLTGEPFHCTQYQFIGSRNDGGFAEYCLVKEENLFPLESISLKTGAMIEIMAVGLHAVRRSGFKSGSAIVFGAGAVGLSLALWLKYFGGKVTVVDIRDYSLRIAKEMEFQNVTTFNDFSIDCQDYIYEASGATAVLPQAIALARTKSTITVVGRSSKDTVFSSNVFEQFMRKELKLCGCWGYNLKGEEELLKKAVPTMPLDKMISHTINLEESVDMLRMMNDKSVDFCKVLISF